MADDKKLYELMMDEFGRRFIEATDIPNFLRNNLNPKLPIRPYQKKAFQYFINYFQENFNGKPKDHQILFHMATGSGKTIIMAGLILYLYEKGYRNFLFFVNNTNIINKTKENFLNMFSNKYLFNEEIIFEKKIQIKEVNSFQEGNQQNINIVFSTIQSLHFDLINPKENTVSYDDFENGKVVMISDEAHHTDADTKKGSKNQSQDELIASVSWEKTVERIFHSNKDNILLEFSATIDFNDENIANKYNPKLIYDYPLKEFRNDGYSKEVTVIQTDLPMLQRALQAVLISQYRRKIFEKYKKSVKPVILFKSKTIKESQDFYNDFIKLIKNLQTEDFLLIKKQNQDPLILKIFDFLNENKISLDNFISEIRDDFSEEKLIEVNSKEESEDKQIAVNSLEVNEYRAVFAVDKLNEGWDVLNLFDIVRLYETRDARNNKVGKTTMSEAQLIGRGARYFPFKLDDSQEMFCRKYDQDIDSDMRIGEVLFYHSSYNPKYIQELNTALHHIGIKSKNTIEKEIKLKEKFKKTTLFKSGHIFLNERIKFNLEDIGGLNHRQIKSQSVNLFSGKTTEQNIFDNDGQIKTFDMASKKKDYLLNELNKSVILEALNSYPFFEFSNLKSHFPNLKSINEFIISDNYLAKIKVEVIGNEEQINSLSIDNQLFVCKKVLENISEIVGLQKHEYIGTKEFKPKMLNSVFRDKKLNFSIDDESEKEYGRSMRNTIETSYYLDLNSKDWYVFDDCFGTSEEKLFIHYLDKKYDELIKKYNEVYLIRNEKHFQIYSFDDGSPFEPDYFLYLIGKELKNTRHYQIFIEPKGSHLLKNDEWKENFLLKLSETFEIEQLFSNHEYVIYGLPFYNKNEREIEFDDVFNKSLLN